MENTVAICEDCGCRNYGRPHSNPHPQLVRVRGAGRILSRRLVIWLDREVTRPYKYYPDGGGFYRLAKWLFPKTPRLVRERKLRMVFFTIFLCIMTCVLVGATIYLIYKMGKK